jgi:hypothetical protein
LLSLLALAFTAFNALIPLQIDDSAYVCYARQAAAHPLDPYGFVSLWYDAPERANHVLAPPVLPYSVAPAIALFGDHPTLWKLSLFPWVLLFTFAVHALLRRFTPGLELALTVFVLFSPAVLPSLNLMLDVPALALSLLAIQLFLGACDRGSASQALLAGLTAALAIETKYTGFTAVGAIVAAAFAYRRPALGLVAAGAAIGGFLGWESIIANMYGRSHFLASVAANTSILSERAALVPVFFSQLGGVSPALVLIGMIAIGCSKRVVLWTGAALALAYAAVALFDASYVGRVHLSERLFGTISAAPWRFQLAEVLFDIFAGIALVVLVRAIRRLATETGADRSDNRFLLAWLAIEVAGYIVLSPFPAVRRVLGTFVVLTVILGRVAARSGVTADRRRLLNGAVSFSVVLAFAFLGIDWLGARAFQIGAKEARASIPNNGAGRVWYSGRWGFRYYAERCGMLPLIPRYEPSSDAELPPATVLHKGDWLVVAEEPWQASKLNLAALPLREATRIVIDDPVPLRTVPCFYGGRTPLEHHEGPRLTVVVYRVVEDCEVECSRQ